MLSRDVTEAWEPHEGLQDILIELHRDDPEASMIGEALVDLDEGLQEWRYRHVKMVERTIGHKIGIRRPLREQAIWQAHFSTPRCSQICGLSGRVFNLQPAQRF